MTKPLTPVGLRLEYHVIRPLSDACTVQFGGAPPQVTHKTNYHNLSYVATLWANRAIVDALNNEDFEGC